MQLRRTDSDKYSDCDQLGVANYFEADKILIQYFKGNQEFENHILVKDISILTIRGKIRFIFHEKIFLK
jgi:hypothetical protein